MAILFQEQRLTPRLLTKSPLSGWGFLSYFLQRLKLEHDWIISQSNSPLCKKAWKKLNAAPQTDEERREQLKITRTTVKTLVEQVLIQKDRQLKIT